MNISIIPFRQTSLIGPTLLVIPVLAILISLGVWQWQRKAWKEELLLQLRASQNAKPQSLSQLIHFTEPDDIRFRRVRLNGEFLHGFEIHIWQPGQKGSGWRILTPFKLARAPAQNNGATSPAYVLVIRGVVDDAHKQYATRPEQPALASGLSSNSAPPSLISQMSITGRVRFDSVNWATPEPDQKRNRWYALDVAKMTAALEPSLPGGEVAPFFVEVEAATAPPPAPQPNLQQLTLRNRHLGYALTWWGLASTLIGVYATFVVGRMRQA